MQIKSKESGSSSLSFNDRTFDGGYRLYWDDSQVADEKVGYLFQNTPVSDWAPLKADKCYVERAYNIKYYGEVTFTVDGEDNVLINGQAVATWAAAQEAPVKDHDGYDLYQDHDDSAEPEITPIEGESCKYLAQQTCPVCGEVIDGEIITEHSAISYAPLTDAEKVAMAAKVSEFVGSMASMILSYCPADYWCWGTCEGCGEKNLTCPVAYYIDQHSINPNGIQAIVFELDEEGEIADYDMGAYVCLPHVFDDQHTCEYCGGVAHGEGDVVIVEYDGSSWDLAYANGDLFDYENYDCADNSADVDISSNYQIVSTYTPKGETDPAFTVTESYDNGGTPDDNSDDVCVLISFVAGTEEPVEYAPEYSSASVVYVLEFDRFDKEGTVSDEDFNTVSSSYASLAYFAFELYDDDTYILSIGGSLAEQGLYEYTANGIEFSGPYAAYYGLDALQDIGGDEYAIILDGDVDNYVYAVFAAVAPLP